MKLEKVKIVQDEILIQDEENFVLDENSFVGFRYKFGRNPRIIGIVALSVPQSQSSILWRRMADAILRPIKTEFLFQRIPFVGNPIKKLYGIPVGKRLYRLTELPIRISSHQYPLPLIIYKAGDIQMLAGELIFAVEHKRYFPIFNIDYMSDRISRAYSQYVL